MFVETPQQWISVNIYVDDSNISIGGQKHKKGSSSWDYDINLLSRLITSKLPYADINPFFYRWFSFYGADLDRNPQLKHFRDCRCPDIVAFDSHRNGWGKEKAADTRLTARMTDRIRTAHLFGEAAYFVVLSGDSDMIPALEMAVMYGFPVHVWSWKKSLGGQLREFAQDPKNKGLVQVHFLDPHLRDITLKWDMPRVADEDDGGIVFTTEVSGAGGEPENRH
jgi:hypothetical protein